MKPNIKLVKDERLIYRYNNVKGFAKKNNNNNENEHSTTSNNYYPQRYSLEDIIFKAFLRGLFFGCIFSALLWKFFNNIPIKFLIAQCLLCILFNVFYDFKSYSPVKYLEIYTLDGIGDDDDVIIDNNQKRRMRRKMHTNCNVYYGSSNSYIIEGELDELKFLRDKITSAIKGCTIAKEMSDEEIFKNDKLKIDKRNKNLNIMRRNQDSLLKDDLTNRKKVKKRSLNGKNRNIEFEKENNIFVKDKSLNIMNRKSNFKNKIKRTIENKKIMNIS
ncbi:hypothetical protein PIROE2DRAFT_61432 [Piromyces sp. E2]|nr:hypothetical protein PIROE2DRAFT_61432 [Piromyces sp. E2]|eukprot:OUM63221.1 hypothetical protein PIROE2DRAFT_61432 [Piromyces sp. E2]